MIKVLVVDDEKGITDSFKAFLKNRNFAVRGAYSGMEAVDIVKREKSDIIFLDLKMKGLDGLETLIKIKEISSKAKVIIVSGVQDQEIMEKALELGADEYVSKPFLFADMDDLLMEKVQELLKERYVKE